MSIPPDSIADFPTAGVFIRRVAPERPWLWLAEGFRDFVRAPRASLLYGFAIALISVGVTALLSSFDRLPLLLPLLAGFALISPFLAVGLYGISRTLEDGQRVTPKTVLETFDDRYGQIALMGGLFMLIHIAWVRVATLLFALFFAQVPVGLSDLLDTLLRTEDGFVFLALGSAIGAVFASGTFALAAISLPMLLDREVGIITALGTSWTAVTMNPVPMALWAGLIALAVLLGFATFFVALIFVMPLVGYATWHAYRDLVPPTIAVGTSSLNVILVESN